MHFPSFLPSAALVFSSVFQTKLVATHSANNVRKDCSNVNEDSFEPQKWRDFAVRSPFSVRRIIRTSHVSLQPVRILREEMSLHPRSLCTLSQMCVGGPHAFLLMMQSMQAPVVFQSSLLLFLQQNAPPMPGATPREC